jgi:hypothetical protein
MSPVGFEPTISTGERPQTYDLRRAANGTGISVYYGPKFKKSCGKIFFVHSLKISLTFPIVVYNLPVKDGPDMWHVSERDAYAVRRAAEWSYRTPYHML